MSALAALGRRLIPYWAAGLVAWYVVSLRLWISPRIVKWGLPFPGAAAPPRPGVFLAGAAGLAVALAATWTAGRGAGRPVARWLRLPPAAAGRDAAAGWGALALVFLGLGLAGCWYPAVLAAALAPFVLAGRAGLRPRRGPTDPDAGWWRHPVFLAPAILLGWLLMLVVLAPESFQDAMRYHLFLPRRFLLEHKFIFVERYFFWSYVTVQQALYGAAIALGGDRAARAVNVALALAGVACAGRLARRAGLAGFDRALALGLAIAAPGLMLITASSFGEHGCWLPVLLALETAVAGTGSRQARLRAIALLFGLAFAAKPTALFGAAGLGAAWAAAADRGAWTAALRRSAAPAAAVFVGPLVPWLALHWLFTGDPLSPQLARWGFATLDASSAVELHAYYRFAGDVHHDWLATPEGILWLPVQFMGAHGGFWEHPGPAIPALLPAAFLLWEECAPAVRQLLAFATGSAGLWIAGFGGISPHYIMGVAAAWTVGAVGVLPAVAAPARGFLRQLLAAMALLLALLSFVAGVFRFGPRDVAWGIITPEYFLAQGLPPRGVHHPVREDLERVAPRRGTVYVLGDDTSDDLSGRVFCDYETGSDPLLWRIAHEADGPRRIRVRLRQRGITHVLYSTRWPDELARAEDEVMRFSPRVALRVQDFWREYAVPVAVREVETRGWIDGGYAFALRAAPAADPYDATFSRRRPFLPGAGILVFAADRAFVDGRTDVAAQAAGAWAAAYGGLAIVQERLAVVAERSGRPAEAAAHRRAARAAGWITRR